MTREKKLNIGNQLLGDIEMAMDDNSYEMEWYLDIQKEETVFLTDFYDEDEQLREIIEDDDNEERFIAVRRRPSHEGWEQMERFILSLDDQDENTQNLLLNTIQGAGAFRRFKDSLYSIGLQDRWFGFKGREDRKEALNWLYSLDLIAEEDIEKGMQLYEELIAKRKQREEDIANMTGGSRVKCASNHSHEDKITIGKTYDVLDEQKEHLNIRIKDDRGKVCWLPKSHFELVRDGE